MYCTTEAEKSKKVKSQLSIYPFASCTGIPVSIIRLCLSLSTRLLKARNADFFQTWMRWSSPYVHSSHWQRPWYFVIVTFDSDHMVLQVICSHNQCVRICPGNLQNTPQDATLKLPLVSVKICRSFPYTTLGHYPPNPYPITLISWIVPLGLCTEILVPSFGYRHYRDMSAKHWVVLVFMLDGTKKLGGIRDTKAVLL